jgi:integrase
MTTRRPRGDGALYFHTAKGRWIGRVTIDGQRRTVSDVTKGGARRKLAELRSAVDAGLPATPGDLTVAALLDSWFVKALPGRNLQAPSLQTHDWARRVLIAELGKRKVRTLTPEQIEAALQRRADNGLSKASLAKLRTTLGMALAWAERRGQVARNVARVVELPHTARTATAGRSMTAEQAQAFLAAADGTPLAAMWTVMLYLGLRPGEAAGLAWGDIDLDHGIVHVRRGLKRVEGGRIVVGPPKTPQSVRSLDAPPPVIAAFRQRRHLQNVERMAVGEVWANPEDLVFTNSVGSPVDPPRQRIAFDAVARAAGIGDGWTPVACRHTAASLMSDAGVPLEKVADQLGHKDTRMASLHYRHRVRPTVDGGTTMADVLDAGRA